MNCKKCGAPLKAEDMFCTNCGTPVNEGGVMPNQNVVNNQGNNDMTGQMMNANVQNNNSYNSGINTNQPVYNQMSNYGNVDANFNNNGFNNVNNNQNMMNNMASQSINYSNPNVNQMGMANQNMLNQNQQSSDDKNKQIMLIAGVAVAVIVIVFGVFLVTKSLSNSKKDDNAGNNNGSNNTPISSKASSYYKVKFNGFIFNIPDDMLYDVTSNELSIGDEDDTWAATLAVNAYSFSSVKGKMNELHGNLQNAGFNVKPATLKTANNVEFITLEAESEGVKFLLAYTKLGSAYTASLAIINSEGTIDYSILDKIAPVTSTAVLNSSSNSISVSDKFKFDINAIGSAIE